VTQGRWRKTENLERGVGRGEVMKMKFCQDTVHPREPHREEKPGGSVWFGFYFPSSKDSSPKGTFKNSN
jgi:hypothetical protein